MPTDITVEERDPQPAMTIRTHTDGHKLLGFLAGTFSSVAAHIEAEGGQIAGPPFAIYHNMNFDDWDVEAGYPIAGEVAGRDDIGPSELPGAVSRPAFTPDRTTTSPGSMKASTPGFETTAMRRGVSSSSSTSTTPG